MRSRWISTKCLLLPRKDNTVRSFPEVVDECFGHISPKESLGECFDAGVLTAGRAQLCQRVSLSMR